MENCGRQGGIAARGTLSRVAAGEILEERSEVRVSAGESGGTVTFDFHPQLHHGYEFLACLVGEFLSEICRWSDIFFDHFTRFRLGHSILS